MAVRRSGLVILPAHMRDITKEAALEANTPPRDTSFSSSNCPGLVGNDGVSTLRKGRNPEIFL
jgi:hypothetical protein